MRDRRTVWAIAVTMTAVTAVLFPAVTAQIAAPAAVAAQATPARMAGKPDFNGIWQANNTANWDIQTHEARPMIGQPGLTPNSVVLAAPVVGLGSLGWVPPGQGVVEGEEIPYQPWAAARKKENLDNWMDRDPEIKCFQPGVPRAMYMPQPFQIIQSTDHIMMVFQFAGAVRTVHMKDPQPAPAPSWMGWSNGRWEGETLVVETTGLDDRTWFDRAGNFHSDELKVIERITTRSADTLNYEATIEDPKTFTRAWKISMPLYRRVEKNAQIMEFKCVEFAEELLYGHLRKQPIER